MPLPIPTDGEGHDDFIDRCMADPDMLAEYDDDDQRAAVCLSQWEGGKGAKATHRGYEAKLEDVDRDKRTLVWRISTDTKDRDQEVILPKGIKLERFKQNPSVLWAHDYSMPPIAKALWTKASAHELISKPRFVAEGKYPWTNADFASLVFEMYADGNMSTSSVGFIPVRGREPTEADLKARPDWAGTFYIHEEVELLEYSAVPVPSNPDALQLAAKAMKLDGPCLEALGLAKTDHAYGICDCGFYAKAPYPTSCPDCSKDLMGSDEEPATVQVVVEADVAAMEAERLGTLTMGPEQIERLTIATPKRPEIEALPAPEVPKPTAREIERTPLEVPARPVREVEVLARPRKPSAEPQEVEKLDPPTEAQPTSHQIERVGSMRDVRRMVRARRRGVVTWITPE